MNSLDILRLRTRRNNPAEPDSTSKLSPYMHLSVLSPREVVRQLEASDNHPSSIWEFRDELLTWREFYHHARNEADPTALENVPKWAYETLMAHADDERPHIYSEEELPHGETDDDTWNAAQKQFLLDGWMHNNLRMYWVKQFIKWRPHPQDAWEMACRFNDRLSLDGRDPVTYGSIQWGFGRAKKAYRENSSTVGSLPKLTVPFANGPEPPSGWLSKRPGQCRFE